MASTALWIAAGVTAVGGVAGAYVYLRKRSNAGRSIVDTNSTAMASGSKSNRGLRLPGISKIFRERKMIFVVNRPVLSNKQILLTGVSTACLHYYRSIRNNSDYYNEHVKSWTRAGQMKVVLKANNSEELTQLLERCKQDGLEAIVLTVGDLKLKSANPDPLDKERTKGKKPNKELSIENQDPNIPAILCVLAPTDKLNEISGHLKLL